ncbi:TetR/AcrR family transcriptional regulator [Eubacteriaceae bacterium ES2]|nr:TetR/AcrR family transcriptional regulator [Eubacteriaceae bacterium ES2]
MNKYELTTNKKKEAIVQAAIALFSEYGVSAVNMKEIASRAHVSQASIYNYFGSKEKVVSECAQIIMSDNFKTARDILKTDLSFPEKIKKSMSICNKGLHASISEYFSQEALQDHKLLHLLNESINQGKITLYRDYIEYGKNEKALDPTIPTELYLSYIEALNHVGNYLEKSNDPDLQFEQLIKLFLYGLIGKSEQQQNND